MKLLLFILLSTFASNIFAVDFIESIQNKITAFFTEKEKKVQPSKPVIGMPQVPQISKNALGNQIVASELAKLYPGGAKFYSMPIQDRQAYDVAFLKELYSSILDRNPSNKELERWVNALSGGASRDGVYRGIVLDREFRSKEQGNKGVVSDKLKLANEKYMNKFLEKTFNDDAYKRVGIISLKKNVVQLTLEMIEELQKKPNEFMNWYAIFSNQMASYEGVWKQDFRKVKQLEFHKKWAKSVPLDHIKSEIIIKLFRLMNGME